MSKKVALHTLGCKLNFSETSTIGSQFLSKGYQIVEFKDKADIYVFNTCTVTEHADRECRQLVRRALRQNPNAYVIVTGCYAQLRPEEISQIQGVDAVLGSNEKLKLFSLLDNFEKKDLACIYVSPVNQEMNSVLLILPMQIQEQELTSKSRMAAIINVPSALYQWQEAAVEACSLMMCSQNLNSLLLQVIKKLSLPV